MGKRKVVTSTLTDQQRKELTRAYNRFCAEERKREVIELLQGIIGPALFGLGLGLLILISL